ncbi:MAG: LysM peptidoglycan-binding domain-containing protein [Planctomycetota bacterium]
MLCLFVCIAGLSLLRRNLVDLPFEAPYGDELVQSENRVRGRWSPVAPPSIRLIQPEVEVTDEIPPAPDNDRTIAAAPETVAYRVQPRDSYWRIARKLLGRGELWPQIQELNPSVSEKRLRAGMQIRVPAGHSERLQ